MKNHPPQINGKIAQKTLEASAHATLGIWSRIKRVWFRWAEFNQHTAWFPFFIGAMVGLDAVIIILPGDIVVALAVISNPKGWKKIWVASALGSALGAFLLYWAIYSLGAPFLDKLEAMNATLGAAPRWEQARDFFKEWGIFSLALGSVIPLLSWPPVVFAGLAKSSAIPVLFYLLLGRFARFLIVGYGVRYGWAFFQTLRSQAQEERAKLLASHPGLKRPASGSKSLKRKK